MNGLKTWFMVVSRALNSALITENYIAEVSQPAVILKIPSGI
jgi:hypothetical protein